MSVLENRWEGWESQEQVDACLATYGRKRSSAALWRRRGLLQKAEVEARGRGSIVHHPSGTCAQIETVVRLLEEKSDLDFVGRRLWWEGYPVDDRYWQPPLAQLAGWLDRAFALLGPLIRRYSHDVAVEALGDRLVRAETSNTILSRIERRLPAADLAQLFGTMLDVAVGQSIGIEIPLVPPPARATDAESQRQRDADWMVRAFDLSAADKHSILGQRFTFRKALPGTFSTLSRAFATGSFSEVMNDRRAIFAARDDFRNALSLGADFYEALKEIYGDEAFGLRLVAWIAEKKPELTIAAGILGFARLRQIPNDLYSSAEIAKMAQTAKRCRDDAAAIRQLRSTHARFKEVLAPERMRAGFRDQVAHKQLLKEIETARLQA